MSSVSLKQAQAAKAAAKRIVLRVDKAAGVGITRVGNDYAVKVNLSVPLRDASSIPKSIDGVAVKVEVIGAIRPR